MSSGHLIKLLRVAKGITQKEASQNLNISQQAYSKIEGSENIDKTAMQKLLAALKSSIQELEELKKYLPPQKRK